MTDRKLPDEHDPAEWARLAREVYDGALRALIAVAMQIDMLRRQAEANRPIGAELGRIQSLLREEVLKLRELMQQPTYKAREDQLSLLSKRELEIVECLVRGLTNREIADHVSLSQPTVKNYLFRIFEKLGISRVELLLFTQPTTPCPNCSLQFGEHSQEQMLECITETERKRRASNIIGSE